MGRNKVKRRDLPAGQGELVGLQLIDSRVTAWW